MSTLRFFTLLHNDPGEVTDSNLRPLPSLHPSVSRNLNTNILIYVKYNNYIHI